MKWRVGLFVGAIYLLILFPIGVLLSFRPLWWVSSREDVSPAEIRKVFVIRLASLDGGSPLRQHAKDIENEETSEVGQFDPFDWALREGRYRAVCCFVVYMASGFFVHWFVLRVMQSKECF